MDIKTSGLDGNFIDPHRKGQENLYLYLRDKTLSVKVDWETGISPAEIKVISGLIL
jgi:hypothetical protein